jgi:hypothetical protein
MAGRISMGARREVLSAVAVRYRSAGRADKGRILDELCAMKQRARGSELYEYPIPRSPITFD